MVRLKRPERLLRMITRFLVKELGLSYAAMLVHDPKQSRYIVYDSRGHRKIPRALLRLDLGHPLIELFQFSDKSLKDKELQALQTSISRNSLRSVLRNEPSLKNHPDFRKRLEAVQRSLRDFRAELAIPGHFKETLVGVLLLGEKLSRRLFTQTEVRFFQALMHDAALAFKTSEYHQHLAQRNSELAEKKGELEERLREIKCLRKKEQETYYQIVTSLAQQVHAKDPYTFGHIQQVERLGVLTAGELGLDMGGRKKDILSAGLLLHDVGKVGIPDRVLKKPASLDAEEWKVMRSHVEQGVKILEPLADFKEVAEIVHCHHEHYNGSGYPRKLKGDQIPIEARIVSVVDAFHAIVSTRCYRKGRPTVEALTELRRCAGTQFDPEVVEALARVVRKQDPLGE